MKKYVCDVCGYIYDPAVGDPDNGIAPGTAFEDIPDDWVCPLCGVGKDDFSVLIAFILRGFALLSKATSHLVLCAKKPVILKIKASNTGFLENTRMRNRVPRWLFTR